MSDAGEQQENQGQHNSRQNNAALTEAVKHVDVVHTSLVGMTGIVIILLFAVALPVFGQRPVTHVAAFAVMLVVSMIGIGGLYFLNFRVHKHITEQAGLTEVLVNSLGQAFLVFGKDGTCGPVYSQACIDLLETVPAGKHVTDVLRVPETQKSDISDWLEVLFQADHALGFDDVIRFLPQYFPHSQNRRISLVYKQVLEEDGNLQNVVVIATDQTEEYTARMAAKRQENFADMICRIFKDRNQFQSVIARLRDFIEISKSSALTREEGTNLLRQLHTLKATVKQFSLDELSEVIHQVESDLRNPAITDDKMFRERILAGRKRVADALVRVTEKVGSIVGEEKEWHGNTREIDEEDLYDFVNEMLRRQTDKGLVKDFLCNIVAVPVRDCFKSFERELQDLASIMDKQIKPIKFVGENPKVLVRPMQEFFLSLTHVCRNIVDHGIETPITRMGRGKDPSGQVTVLTELTKDSAGGEYLHLVISDDGNGIDPLKVRSKLALQDPEGNWRFEDDQTIIQRIFNWGFSTKDSVSLMSGRGVGMEAVQKEVKALGGAISVSSELYNGASIDIKLPYRISVENI